MRVVDSKACIDLNPRELFLWRENSLNGAGIIQPSSPSCAEAEREKEAGGEEGLVYHLLMQDNHHHCSF